MLPLDRAAAVLDDSYFTYLRTCRVSLQKPVFAFKPEYELLLSDVVFLLFSNVQFRLDSHSQQKIGFSN